MLEIVPECPGPVTFSVVPVLYAERSIFAAKNIYSIDFYVLMRRYGIDFAINTPLHV